MEAPVQVELYNPAWPEAFLAERDLLAPVLGRWLAGRIEHVGSTAVPGLSAKPIIDIMAPVKDLESSRPAFRNLLFADPSVAKDYAVLKHRLATAYRHDRERYTEE